MFWECDFQDDIDDVDDDDDDDDDDGDDDDDDVDDGDDGYDDDDDDVWWVGGWRTHHSLDWINPLFPHLLLLLWVVSVFVYLFSFYFYICLCFIICICLDYMVYLQCSFFTILIIIVNPVPSLFRLYSYLYIGFFFCSFL